VPPKSMRTPLKRNLSVLPPQVRLNSFNFSFSFAFRGTSPSLLSSSSYRLMRNAGCARIIFYNLHDAAWPIMDQMSNSSPRSLCSAAGA
jgi:hypothetical protein